MIVVRASVFLKHPMRGHQQAATGLQQSRAFGQIRGGIGHVFQNLRGEDGVVGRIGLIGQSTRWQQAVHGGARGDICPHVVRNRTEERSIRGAAAAVVKQGSRHAAGETFHHGAQIGEAEMIQFGERRRQAVRQIGVGMQDVRQSRLAGRGRRGTRGGHCRNKMA